MKLKISIFIWIFLIPVILYSQVNLESSISSITISEIKAHIDTLASDYMEGRMTGENGQKKAAEYIANYFEASNLTAFYKQTENPYYQKFSLKTYEPSHSVFYYRDLLYEAPVFFSNQSLTDSISDNVYFCGYGTEKDLSNQKINDNSIFLFSESVRGAINRCNQIAQNNEVNIYIVGIPFGDKINDKQFEYKISDFNTFYDLYYFYYYFALDYRNEIEFRNFQINNVLAPDLKLNSTQNLKILFVPEEVCSELFYHENKSLKELKNLSKQNTKSDINILNNVQAAEFSFKVNYDPKIKSIQTENVLGLIDCETTDRTIVIGAHYDHVGKNINGTINYGADDNASGTTAVLMLSRILSELNKQKLLNKDILLIAYTGEEMGLLGSKYFTINPTLPLSNIDVVFNMDMIGRDKDNDPENENRLFILKWKSGKKYIKNIQELNDAYTHLILDDNPGSEHKQLWTYGSDHYSFLEKDISCITYFTGLHPDYHTPGDTPDKINYEKMRRIIQLILLNTIDICNGNN